jgi:hypothetical protein
MNHARLDLAITFVLRIETKQHCLLLAIMICTCANQCIVSWLGTHYAISSQMKSRGCDNLYSACKVGHPSIQCYKKRTLTLVEINVILSL